MDGMVRVGAWSQHQHYHDLHLLGGALESGIGLNREERELLIRQVIEKVAFE